MDVCVDVDGPREESLGIILRLLTLSLVSRCPDAYLIGLWIDIGARHFDDASLS